VSDAVEATVAAALAPKAEGVFNIAGDSRVSLQEALNTLAEVTRRTIQVKHLPATPGEAQHTFADISRAKAILNYKSKVGLYEGLAKEFEWIRTII